MNKLFLHIGTPKTGTTTLQSFLNYNRGRLKEKGIFVPELLGKQSHILLTAYAQNDDIFNTRHRRVANINNHEQLYQFRKKLSRDFSRAIKNISDSDVTVISSESLSNKLTDEVSVSRVKKFLNNWFDEITIVLYLRRQDKRAVSDFDQSIKACAPRKNFFFKIDSSEKLPWSYNYLGIYKLWKTVFPEANFIVRVFERSRLIDEDIVSDFFNIIGSQDVLKFDRVKMKNVSLSASAQVFFIELHNFLKSNNIEMSKSNQKLIVNALNDISSDPPLKPIRSSAEKFYKFFKKDNDELFSIVGMEGFSEDFSIYPEYKDNINISFDSFQDIAFSLIRRLGYNKVNWTKLNKDEMLFKNEIFQLIVKSFS